MQDVWEGQVESRSKTGETITFTGKSEEVVPTLPWKVRSPLFTHC